MTNKDTDDIAVKKRQPISTNIQPRLLVNLMIQSEPCLFANDPKNLGTLELRLRAAAEWHADLQDRFWKELLTD
jgi:hypothetical protein